nr:HEAT repeat domain-containing protein [Ardenticatena sp.]
MSTKFQAAIQHLQSDVPLSTPVLLGLGDPLHFDERTFRDVWFALPVERRRQAATALLDLAEIDSTTDFTPLFFVLLDDPDPEVRMQAVDGLWETNTPSLPRLTRRLLAMLRDRTEDPRVRARAALGLGHPLFEYEMGGLALTNAAEIVETLLNIFRDASEPLEVRRRALESMAAVSNEVTRAAIRDAYAAPEHDMRVSAIFAMGRTGEPEWAPIIRRELGNPSAEIRYEATRAAGHLGDKAAVPALVDLLADPDAQVRDVAIWALSEIGTERAIEALENLLQRTTDDELAEYIEEAIEMARFNALEVPDMLDLFTFEDDPDTYIELGPEDDDDFDTDVYDEVYDDAYNEAYVEEWEEKDDEDERNEDDTF